jgi:hypothetical protein
MFLKFNFASEGATNNRPYINFAYMNVSRIPARGATFKGLMKVFDHQISAEEEDHIMLDMKASVNFPDPRSATNEISFSETPKQC